VEGLNRYAMVGNNPINFADRFGLHGEQVTGTQILGGVILVFLQILIGAGLGWLAGNAMTGAAIGGLVGGIIFAMMRTHEYLQLRPESVAAYTEAAMQQNIETLVARLSAHLNLTPEEAGRFSSFAFEHRIALDDGGVGLGLLPLQTGQIFGYAGPANNYDKATRVLVSSGNPVKDLRRLGYKALEVRDTPKEQPAAQSTYVEAFEVDSPSTVSGRRRTGAFSPSSVSTAPSSTSSTPGKNWEVDKESVKNILSMSSEELHPSILKTIGMVEEGRTTAVHWHKHADGLFSADLHGVPGIKGRGIHRLMFEHLGNRKYKAVELRNH
jgi:hypothetical protein